MKYYWETMFTDIGFSYFPSFSFKENHVSSEEYNPSEKKVTVQEELEDIDIDEI